MKWILSFVLIAPLAWSCTVVQGDRILAGQLAAEAPAFASLNPAIDIAPAPLAGARREVRPTELQQWAEQHRIALPQPVPADVCFERATQTLSAEQLLPLLQAALGEADASIEIVDFNRNPLPLGTVEFERSGLASNGLWRGRLVYGENRSTPVWARVRVTNTATGAPIAVWQQSKEPEVENGDTVRVEVSNGGVLLAFDAPAESSGHIGEGVMVRNPANGARFRAVVEGKGKVAVRK